MFKLIMIVIFIISVMSAGGGRLHENNSRAAAEAIRKQASGEEYDDTIYKNMDKFEVGCSFIIIVIGVIIILFWF